MPIAAREAPGANDLNQVMRTAVHLHQEGRLHDAQPLYREALRLQPEHPDALHLSGLLAHQSGRHLEALELIDRALARLPGFADAHNSRGILLRALGRPDDAIAAFRQAIILGPSSPLPWSNLGNALRDLGRPEEALRAYREAIARDPDLAQAHLHLGLVLVEQGQSAGALAAFHAAVVAQPAFGLAHAQLGRALHQDGRLPEAIDSYRRAVTLEPGLTSAFCDLGAALYEAGEFPQAADALQAALTLDPGRPEAHNWMGNVCEALGYRDQALSAYRQALAGRPDYAEAHFNLGVLLGELHRPVEAVASYRAALTFRADYAEAHASLGLALVRLGRAAEAVTALRRSLELTPGSAPVWYQLGRALQEDGRSREAAAAYARSIAIAPEVPEAHWHRALALLAIGEYEEGWKEYEWRWNVPDLELEQPVLAIPLWDGGSFQGKTLLVRAGLGPSSTLLFARYLPFVAARGGRVVLESPSELTRLLGAMPELFQVVAQGGAMPPADLQVSLESLPRLFRTRVDSVPVSLPYLPCQTWSGRIPVLPPGAGLRVGLVWGGGRRRHPERSLTLKVLAPLLRIPGITWYSLQGGDRATDLRESAEAGPIQDLVPLIRDFTDQAALVGQLDLVVGADDAILHLAGGLGVPLWALLPSAPDWRWSYEGEESPWYPTARVFRQGRPGDWEAVVEEVHRALTALLLSEAGTA